MNNPRLESLLNRLLDGELDAPEAAAVQRMLVEDPEARRAYYELLLVDQMLDERVEVRLPERGMIDSIADEMVLGPKRRRFPRVYLAAAALVVFSLFATFFIAGRNPAVRSSGPVITGSTDSRMTIAQRQDGSHWEVGELLRLERGTAAIRLNSFVSANFDGPAGIELMDASGNIRLLEGMASFEVGAGGKFFDVHVPGGILRDMDSRFSTEVLSDGVANVRVESGFLEIRPRNSTEPVYLRNGDAMRLEPDGKTVPIRLPNQHFRSGLPQQVALFRDDFHDDEGRLLAEHHPQVGQAWQVLSETNPTSLRNNRLDTSTGARRLLARLAPHDTSGSRSVYIFTFHLIPPEKIDDKIKRQDGYESISLMDAQGREFLSIFAKAANGHRWQLKDERSKAVTALTPVCALWKHSLTLCYGLDGRATLHDGSTAQAPVIAELRVTDPIPAASVVLGNRDGGDLACSGLETTLLPAQPINPQ